MNFTVTKNGVLLDKSLYIWDKEIRTFSTNENELVLDFSSINNCTFKTSDNCTFKTGGNCTFSTDWDCVFDTGWDCTFDTGSDCVLVRRDIFETYVLPTNKSIKLNAYKIKGYKEINIKKKIIIDGKEIELSEESYNELKKSLLN